MFSSIKLFAPVADTSTSKVDGHKLIMKSRLFDPALPSLDPQADLNEAAGRDEGARGGGGGAACITRARARATHRSVNKKIFRDSLLSGNS